MIQVSPDLRSAEAKTISRGITVLSNSQSYVKSFDGMAYELKGKLKEGSSTNDITKVTGELARRWGREQKEGHRNSSIRFAKGFPLYSTSYTCLL